MKVDSKLRESVELWREGEKMAQRILKSKELPVELFSVTDLCVTLGTDKKLIRS